jgi:cellulose synthase/poly-beta-1,6-N-acetylglucosamine synthase-like glycosyltransferase
MAGAFDLTNHVRPLGYDRLRLGVGLKGNGMMFSRAVLQRVRWRGDSITEDIDYGLELLRQGIRVAYEPEARVLAQMPVTAAQAASQRERWEGGRYRLLRERASGLLWEGLRKRNVPLINAALNLITPPLAELFSLLAVWGLLVVLGRAAGLLRASGAFTTGWTVASAGFATYVLGGLWLSGARWGVYSALLKAPLYVAWKLWLYARRLPALFSQPSAAAPNWIRTERRPISAVEGDEPLSPNKPTQ